METGDQLHCYPVHGYKLTSGLVAKRLEKYLMKIIGRAQKGFLREKNINTCSINIINAIEGAWREKVPTGVLCDRVVWRAQRPYIYID